MAKARTKGASMKSGAGWHDFPYEQGPEWIGVSGTIGGEHTRGYYITNEDGSKAVAQIVMNPSAKPPDAPDVAYQSPAFHYAQQPIDTTTPQASFDSSGICAAEGWTPGGVPGGYYLVGDRSGYPTGLPITDPEALAAQARMRAAAIRKIFVK